MKHIPLFFLVCVLSIDANGQDAVLVIANDNLKWGWEKAERAIDKIFQKGEAAKTASLLQNSLQMVKLMQESKQLAGVAIATSKDIKGLTEKFQDDFRSIDQLTGDRLGELNEMLSWKQALQGRGYQSMFNAEEMYEANTAKLRGRDGTLSVSGAMMNAISDEHRISTDRAFAQYRLRLQRNQILIHDFQTREHLRMAKYHENQARILTLQLNMHVFGSRISSIGQTVKNLSSKDKDVKPAKSDTEITALQGQVDTHLKEAQLHRSEANKLMNLAIQTEKPYITAANEFINYQRLMEHGISYSKFQGYRKGWADETYIEEEPIIIDWN